MDYPVWLVYETEAGCLVPIGRCLLEPVPQFLLDMRLDLIAPNRRELEETMPVRSVTRDPHGAGRSAQRQIIRGSYGIGSRIRGLNWLAYGRRLPAESGPVIDN